MMNDSINKGKYFASVRNSKAIKSADIAIDAITVLTGINASGKSTIARMVHEIVNLSAIYPLLLERFAWSAVKGWACAIVQLDGRLSAKADGALSAYGVQVSAIQFESRLGKGRFVDVLESLNIFTREVLEKYQEKMRLGDAKRAFAAFVRAVGMGDEFIDDVSRVYAVFSDKRAKCQRVYEEGLSARNYLAYNYALDMKYDLRWLTDADEVSFYEDGEPVYSVRRQPGGTLNPDSGLKEIFGLRQSFYIASPWVGIPTISQDGVLTIKYDDFPHYPNENTKPEDSLFKIIGGTVELDESTGVKRWMYHRSDGLVIDLTDCATGIKAFSILGILYKRGYLNAETLLIIDEPEAHLHPQWIVEYARMLVLISKRLKVRMLLTSHNPDMVSAIQEISECEELSGVRFYLAEKKTSGLQYEYRDLGGDVEPIFGVFNKALDCIELYKEEQDARHI